MKQQDLARELGVSAATVTRDAALGMPTHDVAAARAWRLEHRRPRRAVDGTAGHSAPEGAVAAGAPRLPGAEGDEAADGDGYWASRARRERAEAEMAELKLSELRGELIRRDVMERIVGERAAATRESVMQIKARIAPLLAAESDVVKVAALLDAELRAALSKGAE